MSGDGHSLDAVFEYIRGSRIEKGRIDKAGDLYLELSDSRVMIIVAPMDVAVAQIIDNKGLH